MGWREIVCLRDIGGGQSLEATTMILDNPPYMYFLGLGEWAQLLSNYPSYFLRFFWVCAGPYPEPFSFQDLPGFLILILSDSPTDFLRLDSAPWCHHFGFYWSFPKVLLSCVVSTAHGFTSPSYILASTVHVAKEFSPCALLHHNPNTRLVVPREILPAHWGVAGGLSP